MSVELTTLIVDLDRDHDLEPVRTAARRAQSWGCTLVVDARSAGALDLPVLTSLTRELLPVAREGVGVRLLAPAGEDGRLARLAGLAGRWS